MFAFSLSVDAVLHVLYQHISDKFLIQIDIHLDTVVAFFLASWVPKPKILRSFLAVLCLFTWYFFNFLSFFFFYTRVQATAFSKLLATHSCCGERPIPVQFSSIYFLGDCILAVGSCLLMHPQWCLFWLMGMCVNLCHWLFECEFPVDMVSSLTLSCPPSVPQLWKPTDLAKSSCWMGSVVSCRYKYCHTSEELSCCQL